MSVTVLHRLTVSCIISCYIGQNKEIVTLVNKGNDYAPIKSRVILTSLTQFTPIDSLNPAHSLQCIKQTNGMDHNRHQIGRERADSARKFFRHLTEIKIQQPIKSIKKKSRRNVRIIALNNAIVAVDSSVKATNHIVLGGGVAQFAQRKCESESEQTVKEWKRRN